MIIAEVVRRWKGCRRMGNGGTLMTLVKSNSTISGFTNTFFNRSTVEVYGSTQRFTYYYVFTNDLFIIYFRKTTYYLGKDIWWGLL